VSEAGVEEVRSFESRSNATMAANVGYVLSEADVESLPVSDVVAGTRIIAGGAEGGFRHVVLPGGREGYAREEDIGGPTPAIPDRVHLVERAKRFIGIPYIWGGASPKGFDCSGFVKIVFRIEGIELPRDSDLLARMGRAITLDAASVGDLLFFGEGGLVSHVAICLGEGRFIHSYGDVRINSLYADDPLYEEKLAKTLLFARCILPEGQ
jgi:hypothetical protein